MVELGCGDGRFSARLRLAGARVVGVDRRGPAHGSTADVVADALRPPLSTGGVDLLVAANLLRHLWSRTGGAAVPRPWRKCLRPGGHLYIFEDEPGDRPVAVDNYRCLQRFLCRLDPGGRGPLLSGHEFERRATETGWNRGEMVNRETADSEAVLAMLDGSDGTATGEAARLAESIRRHGLVYGRYWWARWTAPEVAA